MYEHPEIPSARKLLLPERALHVCPQCDSELVQPVAWSAGGPDRLELTRRCPNCEWAHTGTHEREQVEALEEYLDQGVTEMLADLRRLTYVNMSDEISRFATALDADQILPEDF